MPDQAHTRSEIRPVKERIEDELLAIPGVNAVDINEKVTNGESTGRLSIVVFVDEKKAKSKLRKGEEIPAEIDGIPTDVQEEKVVLQAGAFQALVDVEPQIDVTKYTPLRGGISMGPCRSVFLSPPDVPTAGNYVFTGTFGAVVKDRASGAAMALTNFHVACVDSTWSVGDTMAQPSRVDGGTCPGDRFGTLTRAVLSDNVDGAVVTIDAGKVHDCSIEGIGAVRGTAAAAVGMGVRKRGRTTELTHGSVNSTDVSVSIDYGDGLGAHTLKHQIRVAPDTATNPRFSDRGDSGSVVVTADNKVIGLLFGGTLSGSATFVNPIQSVLDELGVDLCIKPKIVLTSPVLCPPIITKRIFCTVTRPVICDLITKPVICQIATSPRFCEIRTYTACPPISLACPPVSRACGFDPELPPIRELPGGHDLGDTYGRPDDGTVDDAFWFGYYTALEAMSEAEGADDGDADGA